jgi:ADP-ribosylglycohydrolase
MTAALDSLLGLSVGDAFGAQFFADDNRHLRGDETAVPPPPWPWTDDTEMACNLVDILLRYDGVDQDALAAAFAARYDPYRGYGPGTVVLLRALRTGGSWRSVARAQFGGGGSMGNGAAMRVAPLGAHYPGDLDRAAAEAAASAEVTHAHPEGVAGAVAVAVAAAYAAAASGPSDEAGPSSAAATPHGAAAPAAASVSETVPAGVSETGPAGAARSRTAAELIDAVIAHTPSGEVHDGVVRARGLLDRERDEAAYELGNGARVLAQDTVPFCVWTAARYLTDYERAVRACVAVGGDVDTTAAITGGIVAAHTGGRGVPAAWRDAREPLPDWVPGQ